MKFCPVKKKKYYKNCNKNGHNLTQCWYAHTMRKPKSKIRQAQLDDVQTMAKNRPSMAENPCGFCRAHRQYLLLWIATKNGPRFYNAKDQLPTARSDFYTSYSRALLW